jgi:hypothetical protein
MANVYHCFAFLMREKGNNFYLRVSCVMPEMLKHEHLLKIMQVMAGVFIIVPSEGLCSNHDYQARVEFMARMKG